MVMNSHGLSDPDGIVSIAASVATGMEEIAATEVRSKILKTSDKHAVKTKQGRIYFQISKDLLPDIHSLRSVDRLFLVIRSVEEYVYPETKEASMLDLKNLAQEINWPDVTKFWGYNTPYLKEKCKQDDLGKKPPRSKKRKHNGTPTEKKDNRTSTECENSSKCIIDTDDSNVAPPHADDVISSISFRVTTNRVGKSQPVTSPEASYQFGGEIQNITQWKVDLTGYNLEILLCLGLNSLEVTLALTLQSLHRRNITHFGITTLRATTSYNMLQLCNIQPGDIVIDPMCGSGSIPIEGALEWPRNFYIAGDNASAAVTRCRSNVEFLDKNPTYAMKYIDKLTRQRLPLDTIKWDVTNLPIKTSSVDVIVSDLPFGKRVGSKVDNRRLYPAILKEVARVTIPESGRACLLTQDKRTILRALDTLNEFWSVKKTLYINIGGLTAGLFLLKRFEISLDSSMDTNIVELCFSEGCSAKICLFGATVTSWINNGQEQLFLSSVSKMDGTKAVRGGIPIVFPNFGPWDSGPQHGFARISWWKLAGTEKDGSYAKATFHLKENDNTLSMWNHKFELIYEVEIRCNSLKTTLTIKNTGNDDFDFTTLLHTYLRVPDIQECTISGFRGCSYADKVKKENGKIESRAEVTILENVDAVYQGTEEHIVKCHGAKVKVTKTNLPDTVLWNPWITKAKEMSDFDDDGYKHMVCVEPGYVSERKVLQPGLAFTCSQTLTLNQVKTNELKCTHSL